MNHIARFELRVLASDKFVPVDAHEAAPAALLEGWLANERLSCCSIQAGIFIDIDGVPWSDEGTVDEVWMTRFWFAGIVALHEGATSFGAWQAGPNGTGSRECVGPWEESNLCLTRSSPNDDMVEMVDEHSPGNISMRPVRVSVRAHSSRTTAR